MTTMIKVTTTMTTRVTIIIITKTLAKLDSKMQYFPAMHNCSCLFFTKPLCMLQEFTLKANVKSRVAFYSILPAKLKFGLPAN